MIIITLSDPDMFLASLSLACYDQLPAFWTPAHYPDPPSNAFASSPPPAWRLTSNKLELVVRVVLLSSSIRDFFFFRERV